MEKKIVVSRPFRKNTQTVYEYLGKKYSAKTAFNFLDKLQQRVELIIHCPEIGKPSQRKQNVRRVYTSTTQQNLLQAQQKQN